MTTTTKTTLTGLALVAIASATPLAAVAQAYPAKPVRFIIPFPPGGATDILGRILGQKLGETLGQQFIVDNRGGASGNLGLELAAKAPPDGYTVTIGQAANLAINLSLMGKLPYDPVRDFTPITMIATSPNLLVVHPSLPVKSMKDLVALAKAKPGALNYASSGNGSPGHLAAELFKQIAGIQMTHIPYKGAGPALTDVVAGHAQLYFTAPISAQPFVKGGRLRMVAVTTAKRSPSLPDVPTVAESGYPGMDVASWWALLAPAGTPKDVIARLHTETVKILGTSDMRERLAAQGADAAPGSPEQLGAYIKSEIANWAKMVKTTGVKID